MPKVEGSAEKIDKRARGKHVSHKFLGIHDKELRAKSIDINISTQSDQIDIILTNKMDHPLIIQAARVKYLEVKFMRGASVVWKNYTTHPREDKQGYFASTFTKDGEKIIIPAKATAYKIRNNLAARERKVLHYRVGEIQSGDRVEVSLYVKLAKDDCLNIIKLEDRSINTPILMKSIEKTIE